jgi:hypothetical protein
MNPLPSATRLRGRRFVSIFASLSFGCPAIAQQPFVSAPLSAGEVMARVVEMNNTRAKALEGYSSRRTKP